VRLKNLPPPPKKNNIFTTVHMPLKILSMLARNGRNTNFTSNNHEMKVGVLLLSSYQRLEYSGLLRIKGWSTLAFFVSKVGVFWPSSYQRLEYSGLPRIKG